MNDQAAESVALEPDAPDATAATRPKTPWAAPMSLAPVILAVLTAMFYLNGRAYFLGYLDYFHLEATMFNDDLGQQVTRSVDAWFHLTTDLTRWVGAQFGRSIILMILIPIFGVAFLCVGAASLRAAAAIGAAIKAWIAAKVRPIRSPQRAQESAQWIRRTFTPPPLVKPFLAFLARVYTAASFSYLLIWTITAVLIVLVGPFDSVGRSAAEADRMKGFSTSPTIAVKNDDGTSSRYRVMLCGPIYCALFDGTRAITVPASSVTRAESPAPTPIRHS